MSQNNEPNLITEPGPALPQRRQFLASATGLGTAALIGASLPITPLKAQSGNGYTTLNTPMATADESRVEVLEFFWFGCPHCYSLEPTLNAWDAAKPDYVDFVREAPPLNASWQQHSRAFYAAEAFGITAGFFDEMFNRIHRDRKPMRDPRKIARFVESLDLGVTESKFRKAMDSFSVETALKRSMMKAQQAGITGVPSIIVNGKYLTGNSIAGSHEGIIRAINELTEFEHAPNG